MSKVKIEGIVINETNYSESSKILKVYTKEHGIISVISRGCRRLKSPLRSVSTRFSYGDFIINYKENSLSILISVDIKENYKNILMNIKNISYATYILDLATQVAKQNANVAIFDLLIIGLKKIDEGIDPYIITLILELQYLKYLGIDINVDCCSNCGSNKNIITVNVEQHGYICKNCYQNEPVVTEKTIKVIRLLYYVDIEKITKITLNDVTIKELNKFLEDYYDKYSGIYLKSKHFIQLLN